MTHSYLLEVGVEEMPAHVVTKSIAQLHQRVANFLKEERIDFAQIQEFATPRRLALLISGLADKQPDVDEEVKGPAKKIALDADGNWTKAAQGFTRGQGVSVDDIEFKAVKGVEYVFVNKHVAGQPVAKVLAKLPDVITAMNFPTLMKWGSFNLQFIRPIRWLVSLLDDQVVPFSILNVTAGRTTQGHRFLGHAIDIATATDYEAALKADFVIADQAKRKALIQEQIHALVAEHDWVLDEDLELLEEVNNLVEWPTAFAGAFDEKYLVLPEEVLITSMRDNQRFFCVRDHAGKLLPHFISVRNGNRDHLDNVIKGNERVLVPRLEDAKFFYEEDQKLSIDQYVARLSKVSFHDQISSMAEKMARTGGPATPCAPHATRRPTPPTVRRGAGRPSSLTRRWSAWRTPTPARLSAKRSWPSTTSSPGTICAGAAWAAKNRLRPPIHRPPLGKRQAGTKRPAAPHPKYISTPPARPARRPPQPARKRSRRRAPGRERSRRQKPPAAPPPAGAGLRPEGARPANRRRTQSPKDAVPAGESRRAAARP